MLRALLLSLAILLLYAGSAAAQCAWVMWEHVWYSGAKAYLPGYGQMWTPTGAATQATCERERGVMERQYFALAQVSPKPDPDKSVQWVCLPDTVDPRGPKGR